MWTGYSTHKAKKNPLIYSPFFPTWNFTSHKLNTEIHFIGLNDKGVDDLENTAPGIITVIKPILENAEIDSFFQGEMELFQLFTFRVV